MNWLFRSDRDYVVTEVHPVYFYGALETGRRVQFAMDDVSRQELQFVVVGAKFRHSRGRVISRAGQVSTISFLDFGTIPESD